MRGVQPLFTWVGVRVRLKDKGMMIQGGRVGKDNYIGGKGDGFNIRETVIRMLITLGRWIGSVVLDRSHMANYH